MGHKSYSYEYADVRSHWIALFYNGNFYFDSFAAEHVPKEI